ncbi:MAG: hypothetical protein MAG453_00296 [Calditrichaeota bacterium]|nr:hypothetical protein [Calditrichota bacterium]
MISMRGMRRFLAGAVVLSATLMPAYGATLRGVVSDAETGRPLTGANVVIEGARLGAATDLDGAYLIFNVEPGAYRVAVTMLGYERRTVSDVNVAAEGATTLDVRLEPAAVELAEVTFTAGAEQGSEQRELEDRLEKNEISDAISTETLRRLPDPDVANAVRRATGVAVDRGDPIVRGLGARYSKVTMNNAAISGTEPNRSAVSLELFPSSLMDQVTINKSFLPDQNGEFAGGVVNMSTLRLPRTLQVSASASASYNSRTTFGEFHSYRGGELDWLGFDDGARAMPELVAGADRKLREGNFTPDELARIGKSFSNTWTPASTTASPNQSYSVSIGNRSRLFGRPAGYMVTGLYSRSSRTIEADRNVFKGGLTPGAVELWHDYQFRTYTRAVNLGAMAAARLALSHLSNINFNLLFSRDVSDETRFFSGYNDDRQTEIRSTRLRWLAEQTVTGQLFGTHALPGLLASTLDWRITYSRGSRDEPDTRETQYERDGQGRWLFADETYSGSRIFNELDDRTLSGGIDWTVRPLGDEHGLELKTGAYAMQKRRVSDYHRFEFEESALSEFDAEFLSQDPEQLFAPGNINPLGWQVTEYTRPNDSYKAAQDLYAGYLMADVPLGARLFLSGGVRYEHSTQRVSSFEPFRPTADEQASELATGDLLPALSVRYTLHPRMNLRFAASRTISRPDFRELSEFEFTDFVGGRAVIGNPELDRALIRNYDLRWEMVHGVADLVAVSVFVKEFENPIETVIEATAQNRISYANAESARNYGVEFELRQNLARVADQLRAFTLTTNLSLIESSVDVSRAAGRIQTSGDRPLMGQSPYLFNVGLGYVHPRYGTQINLFYNTFGERIAEVGANGLPNVIEQPRHDLDVSARHPLGNRLSLKLAVTNVLDAEHRFEQGSGVTERYRAGRVVSLGISYTN